jgi:adenosylhomocysteine nucleosidase
MGITPNASGCEASPHIPPGGERTEGNPRFPSETSPPSAYSALREVLAVSGFAAEAKIAAGPHIVTVCGGGRSALLARRIEDALARDVAGVMSFGIAGALDPKLRCGDCVIAGAIVSGDKRWSADARWSDAIAAKLTHSIRADVAGSDEIVSEPSHKRALFERSRAACVDMESHAAARIAQAHGLPFAVVRVVCDPAARGLPHAATVSMREDGGIDLARISKSVLTHPTQLRALVRTGIDAAAALRALADARALLGGGLGFPDFDELPLDVL